MSFLSELVRWSPASSEIVRNDGSFQAYIDQMVLFQQSAYGPAQMLSGTIPGEKVEPVTATHLGYATGIYKAGSPIFSVSMARARLFSEMRFAFRTRGSVGGGNDLRRDSAELGLLEQPGGPRSAQTTQSMLTRMEQDVTTAGTAFLALSENEDRILRRRPDWMEFILSAPPDEAVETDVVGYRYTVGGPRSGGRYKLYLPGECIHWAPIPDPEAEYRGMSWLTPIVEEFQADRMATRHKLKFFENGATPNIIMVAPPTLTVDQFRDYVRLSREASAGVENAYKTLHVGGGMDPRVVGADFRQIDFRATQGAGETRIAMAGGVPPIIVGMSEGLSSATYSNYGQARRAFADTWASNQWRSVCAAIRPLINVPDGAELWYDTRDIPFLREDVKDLAAVQSTQMGTINAALAAGWTSESAQEAVLAEDFSKLKHSGLMSVQLQPPITETPDEAPEDVPDTEAEAIQETSQQATTINGLMATGFWEPESVKAAVLGNDLNKLVFVEPEPAEEEAEPVDPEQEEADLQEQPG